MNDTEDETPVIFTWADREGSSWWLAAFIFLSFLMHSAAFFLFQGKTPAPPRALRTAPMVQLLTPPDESAASTPETAALLQWIATHDPALVAKVQTIEPTGLLDVPYHPSFQTIRTRPLGAPLDPPTIQLPPARDPLALIRSVSPAERPAAATPPSQPTEIRFSISLQSRSKEQPTFTPAAKTNATVQPTIVLAGVNADGEMRFAFVQQASGDSALDNDALAFIRELHFAPSGEPMQWGTVTVTWGDDTIAPLAPK